MKLFVQGRRYLYTHICFVSKTFWFAPYILVFFRSTDDFCEFFVKMKYHMQSPCYQEMHTSIFKSMKSSLLFAYVFHDRTRIFENVFSKRYFIEKYSMYLIFNFKNMSILSEI